MKLYKSNLVPIILFAILSLIFTFPIIFNMSKLIYGYPDDTLATLGGFWYYKLALLHNLDSAKNVYIAFPFGGL